MVQCTWAPSTQIFNVRTASQIQRKRFVHMHHLHIFLCMLQRPQRNVMMMKKISVCNCFTVCIVLFLKLSFSIITFVNHHIKFQYSIWKWSYFLMRELSTFSTNHSTEVVTWTSVRFSNSTSIRGYDDLALLIDIGINIMFYKLCYVDRVVICN